MPQLRAALSKYSTEYPQRFDSCHYLQQLCENSWWVLSISILHLKTLYGVSQSSFRIFRKKKPTANISRCVCLISDSAQLYSMSTTAFTDNIAMGHSSPSPGHLPSGWWHLNRILSAGRLSCLWLFVLSSRSIVPVKSTAPKKQKTMNVLISYCQSKIQQKN